MMSKIGCGDRWWSGPLGANGGQRLCGRQAIGCGHADEIAVVDDDDAWALCGCCVERSELSAERSWAQAALGFGWLPVAPGIQLRVTARSTVAVARVSPWPTVSTSSVGAYRPPERMLWTGASAAWAVVASEPRTSAAPSAKAPEMYRMT